MWRPLPETCECVFVCVCVCREFWDGQVVNAGKEGRRVVSEGRGGNGGFGICLMEAVPDLAIAAYDRPRRRRGGIFVLRGPRFAGPRFAGALLVEVSSPPLVYLC